MVLFPVRKVSEKRASLGLTVKTRLVEGRGRVTGKMTWDRTASGGRLKVTSWPSKAHEKCQRRASPVMRRKRRLRDES